jgi:hypothetical protein
VVSSEVLLLADQALETSWGDLEAVFPAFPSLLTSLVLEASSEAAPQAVFQAFPSLLISLELVVFSEEASWAEVPPVLQAALDLVVSSGADPQVA